MAVQPATKQTLDLLPVARDHSLGWEMRPCAAYWSQSFPCCDSFGSADAAPWDMSWASDRVLPNGLAVKNTFVDVEDSVVPHLMLWRCASDPALSPASASRLPQFPAMRLERKRGMSDSLDQSSTALGEEDSLDIHTSSFEQESTEASPIRIVVNVLTGSTIELEMNPHETIIYLKHRVQEQSDIPVLFQKLIIDTSVANDHERISTYHRMGSAELHVTLLRSIDDDLRLEGYSTEDQLCALRHLQASACLPQMVSQVRSFLRSSNDEVRRFAQGVWEVARKKRRLGMVKKCPRKGRSNPMPFRR